MKLDIKKLTLVSIFIFCAFFVQVKADQIVDAYKYAKVSEDGSLINMKPTGYGLDVTSSGITGYAWSENFGWINFNPTGYGVDNDGDGNLSGYAWGEDTGWINFDPTGYGVTIDSDGYFHGYAWSENIGWIAFNCDDDSSCGTHKVQTEWTAPPDDDVDDGGGGGGGGDDGEDPIYQCSNGIDDDSDGFVDLTDSGCDGITDDNEISYVFCELFPLLCVEEDPIDDTPPDEDTPPIDEENPVDENPPTDENPGEDDTPPVDLGGDNPLPPIIQGSIDTSIAVYSSPNMNFIASTFATIGLALGALGALLSVLFINPLSISELIFLPLRLWSLLLTALGLKKRNRPWGVVYDSITKQPLDPAYVVLKDMLGNEVSTTITDLDGRYGFLVTKGTYTITPGKTNYTFPSSKLSDKTKDELYSNLYFGGEIVIESDEDVVSRNIPMDPVSFDWNEFTKKERKLTIFYSKFDRTIAIVSNVLFMVGFALATLALIAAPKTYNIVIFSLYIFLLILKETALRPRPEGKIIHDGAPLPFAIIRVFQESTGVESTHKVSSKEGKFYCLIANGRYFVSIEKKLADGTYQKIYTSHPFDVKDGYIHETFNIVS